MSATLDEVTSQPDAWQRALGRAAELNQFLVAPGERVLAIGCGTSAFVAQALARLREGAGFGETDAAYASEMPVDRQYDRVVAVTRSGTTTEILAALRSLPAGTRRVVLTAVGGQAVDELADDRVVFDFADEASVVQTRFPTSVLVAARAALGLPRQRVVQDGRTALAAALPVDPSRLRHFVFLGTGWTVGLAHEAALKVREMAQCWSESYPAMDFRHGPVAAVTSDSLVWLFGRGPAGVAQTAAAAGATVYCDDDLDPLAVRVSPSTASTVGAAEPATYTWMHASNLRNLANTGLPASEHIPNDGTGYDHDSVGLFQQRPASGWGSVDQLMDPATSTHKFLQALQEVPGWESMPVTVAAQTVQGSAFPQGVRRPRAAGPRRRRRPHHVTPTTWTVP